MLERRIRLGAGSFPRYLDSPFFILSIAAIVAAVLTPQPSPLAE